MSESILERLWRRTLMATGIARVATGKDDGPTQVLQLNFGVNEVHDGRFRLAEYGFTSMPLPGADAAVVFLGGDRSAGVVIATGDRRYRLKNLASGEVALYDDQGQAVHLTRSGIVIKGAGKPVTITNTPKLVVQGDIEATGDVKAGTVSLQQHKHLGVTPGSGLSGLPQP